LVSAWYHLSAVRSLAPDPEVASEVAIAAALVSEALEDSRRAITGLRPTLLDDLGLSAALASIASDVTNVSVTAEVEDCSLAPHVETAVFRIAQECLQNVVKHAQATRVQLRLAVDTDCIVFSIVDDGVGFDITGGRDPTSFGLLGMHERASLVGATLNIRSAPGQGTGVRLAIPLDRSGIASSGRSNRGSPVRSP